MDIRVACPANCATGGPEAIHLFVSTLDKIAGVDARIWYWDIKNVNPCPSEYEPYHCRHIKALPAGYSGVLIVPEIWANRVLEYSNCVRAIWWLGVDAYAGWTPPTERGAFLKDDSIIHIVQSEYARDFLQKLGCRHIYKCDDVVNADFYKSYKATARGDEVLYNPAKETPFLNKIIKACPDIKFKPLKGMTRAEVVQAMRSSKLYIDFGEFPGRERMPREAVLCGCCIITGNAGAAAYAGDFLHDYKYDSKEGHIWAIAHRIRYVLNNYEECCRDFDKFRAALKVDRECIPKQCAHLVGVFDEVQHSYPGI